MQLQTRFVSPLTIMGEVFEIHAAADQPPAVTIRLHSGDLVRAFFLPTSDIDTLKNLDLESRGRENFGVGSGRSADSLQIDQSGADEKLPTSDAGSVDSETYRAKMKDHGYRDDESWKLWQLRGKLLALLDTSNPAQIVIIEGNYYVDGGQDRYETRKLTLLSTFHPTNPQDDRRYLFEHTAWWIEQITRLADQWLDGLFGEKRTYLRDDFAALYRTNLNIYGLPTDDASQEVATLSRLIYGFTSAYLLTGQERYLMAAQAGVDYQREAFRIISADGRFCFWAHAKRKLRYGCRKVLPSSAGDDFGAIPLYEQIYALAGLTHYYRITYDPHVLHDIRRTIASFDQLFRKRPFPSTPGTGGQSNHSGPTTYEDPTPGYYSHIDPVTFSPHDPNLGKNRSRKNWNSIGDHIPAYLIDLILALDPLPPDAPADLSKFLDDSKRMLEDLAKTIVVSLVRLKGDNPYVVERLKPGDLEKAGKEPTLKPGDMGKYFVEDKDWDWQQNRAVVGHNLKIAWNMTRVAFYSLTEARKAANRGETADAKGFDDFADELSRVAIELGMDMEQRGMDQVRGGCFDTVERAPRNGMWVQFPWQGTKDFWQQEQAVLAYYIMYGMLAKGSSPERIGVGDGVEQCKDFLKLARESSAFWNAFIIDRERSGIFFRVNSDGQPIIEGHFGLKGNHSISGYHAFELNYLAQIYQRSFLPHREAHFASFVMNFHVHRRSRMSSINVLPDFVPPNTLRISKVTIGGFERPLAECVSPEAPFQVRLKQDDYDTTIEVVLQQIAGNSATSSAEGA